MTQQHDLQTLTSSAPIGKTQQCVIIYCFLIVMLDGFDTAVIGFIAPGIHAYWQLAADDLVSLSSVGLLELTVDALFRGPLSDRFGRKRVIGFCVALLGILGLLSASLPDLQTLAILCFLTGLRLGGAMPNTVIVTSEYLPVYRHGALVTMVFCGFTLGSAMDGIVSVQLVPVTSRCGIPVLGGVLPLMLFVALLFTLLESPYRQARRQSP